MFRRLTFAVVLVLATTLPFFAVGADAASSPRVTSTSACMGRTSS